MLRCRNKSRIASKAFDITKLKQPEVKTAFELQVANRFAALEVTSDVEEEWNNFRDTVSAAAIKVMGYKRGSEKEQWISTSSWKAIDERKQLKQQKLNQHLTDEQRDSLAEQYKVKDKEVKGRCATDKQAWYDLKASEAEEAAE